MKAAVFDLDGTLVDSAPDIARALNFALAGHGAGAVTDDQVRAILGGGARVLVRQAIELSKGDLADLDAVLADYTRAYRERPVEATTVHADAVDALRALKNRGVKIGVCTNKRTELAREVLRGTGLAPFVDAVTGIDAVPDGKPDPRHLCATLSELGVDPTDTVYVGDTVADVETARRAGVSYRHVAWGHPVAGCEVLFTFGALFENSLWEKGSHATSQ